MRFKDDFLESDTWIIMKGVILGSAVLFGLFFLFAALSAIFNYFECRSLINNSEVNYRFFWWGGCKAMIDGFWISIHDIPAVILK